jgi:hypothetical protein
MTIPSYHTNGKETEHVPLRNNTHLLVSGLRERAVKRLGEG